MMWNIDFELFSSIILLILILLFYSRIRFPNIANKMYGYLIVAAFVASIINIANCLTLNSISEEWILSTYIFTTIYLAIIYALPPILLVYLISAFSTKYIYSKLSIVLIFIPYMIEFVEIIASPVNNYVFKITIEEGLVYNSGINLIYIINTLYLISYMVLILSFRKRVPLMVKISSVIYVLFSIALQAINYHNSSSWLLTGFITSISFLILFFSIHNPTIMIDETFNIFNKRALTELLDINLENKKPIHVITIALDNYKLINETFGFSNGEAILRKVCEFIKTLSPKKQLYRYSDYAFTIVIPQSGNYNGIIKSLSSRFSDVWNYNDIYCKLTATISIITAPDFASNSKEIYDLIEFTLAEMKQLDKGSIICSDAYLKAKMTRAKKIEIAISNAIDNGSFQVYYQPIYNIEKQKYTSAEALIRLYDEELGAISPDEFITIAEKNGSIVEIGKIVLEKVCHFISKVKPEDYGFEFISVNLSVVQCMQDGIIDILENILDSYRVSKKMIHFEITETVASNSMSLFSDLLNKMSKRGFHLTLDDYGSGYSTLSYILYLPFNTVKLDKTLIDNACENSRSRCIFDYTLNMLQDLDVNIIAEGAENDEQVKMLKTKKCDYIQGYYFSKPLKSDDFIELIQKNEVL